MSIVCTKAFFFLLLRFRRSYVITEIGLRHSMYPFIEHIANIFFRNPIAKPAIMYYICVSPSLWCHLAIIAHVRKVDEFLLWVPLVLYVFASTNNELHVRQVSRNRRRKVAKRVRDHWQAIRKVPCNLLSNRQAVGRPLPPASPPDVLCSPCRAPPGILGLRTSAR